MTAVLLLCLIFSYKFMKKKSECLGIYHYRWQKIGKMMKLCIILVCLFSFSLSATTLAQRERVSMKLQEVSLRQVLEQIREQTNLQFMMSKEQGERVGRVSVNAENATVAEVLDKVFASTGLTWVINEDIIVVKERPQSSVLSPAPDCVKGVVKDEKGNPLPGVTVRVKGTILGTSTDADGRFSLLLIDEKEMAFVFSFVGMQTTSYNVVDDKEIRIVMHESLEALEEVIVTGMEVIKKERMTGSATVVTAKDLQMQGVTSLDRIFEGRIAGLNSTTLSGAPGRRAKITIRGENNLSGNTEPLWVVDGLPLISGVPKNNTGNYANTIMQDGVGNIMPEDIESISILKDASAAAIYGARAANGVIVITTKKGFRSKTLINYSGTYNVSIAPRNRLDFMNSSEKLWYEQSIIDNFGLGRADFAGRGGYLFKRNAQGYLSSADYNKQLQQLSSTNTDWFDVLFRTAHSQSHNISLRGGSEELTYYTSVNFQQQNGILRSNQYQNAGVLVKLEYRPTEKLIFALNLSANTRKNEDHASAVNPFTYAVFANPYEKPYNEDGSYASDLSYLPNNYTTETASGYLYDRFNILRELTETREKLASIAPYLMV